MPLETCGSAEEQAGFCLLPLGNRDVDCLFVSALLGHLPQVMGEACCPFPGINAGSLFKKELLNLLSPVQIRSCECRQKQGVGTPGMTPASPRHAVAMWNPPEFSSNNYVGVSLLGEV